MGFTWLALVYVALSALAYATLDLLRKVLVEGMRPLPLLLFLSVFQLPLFFAWVLLEPVWPHWGYVLPAVASIVLNVVANVLYLEAVRLSPLSLTIPFLSLTPVFTAAVAVPVLREVPSLAQVVGILFVVAGALLLNLARGTRATPRALWSAFRSEPGSVLMTFVALSWSVAGPLDKIALAHANVPFHALVLNGGVALGVLLVLVLRRQTGQIRLPLTTLRPMLLAVIVSVAGLAFVLLAIQAAWVGLVETLRRAIGAALALVVGYKAFAEPITGNKVLAVVWMALGVALILL